jgi:hypothetical protein
MHLSNVGRVPIPGVVLFDILQHVNARCSLDRVGRIEVAVDFRALVYAVYAFSHRLTIQPGQHLHMKQYFRMLARSVRFTSFHSASIFRSEKFPPLRARKSISLVKPDPSLRLAEEQYSIRWQKTMVFAPRRNECSFPLAKKEERCSLHSCKANSLRYAPPSRKRVELATFAQLTQSHPHLSHTYPTYS